jgi:DtxR family Mn-dependent transcriptional regulator
MNDLLLVIGVALLLVAVAWPQRGVLGRWRTARQLAQRAQREDALKHILKSEVNEGSATLLSVAGALHVPDSVAAEVLRDLESAGLVSFEEGRLRLRKPGRELAVQVVRAHRLWESYLAQETGFSEARWHRLAERKEHLLSPHETDALAARLGNPLVDPHGDAIPERGGELPADVGVSVNTVAADVPFTIVHLEDEPEEFYRQLLALGLRPGMRAYVVSKTPDKLRLFADGKTYELPPSLAQNVSVIPLAEVTSGDLRDASYLNELPAGERARVAGLTGACRGAERRRLLDLGFVPGSVVEAALVSPAGDPVAYLVRGGLIALRDEQARFIRIEPLEAKAAA